MAILVELCNRALAIVAKGQIVSLTEGSFEARECARAAQPLLDEMILWSDNMPLGRRRVVLAEVENDRPAEWLHAYAAPNDMGTPLAIRSVEDAATDLPEAGPYNFPPQAGLPLRYLHENGKIYSNVDTAMLVYTGDSLSASDLDGLMRKAFVDELALRISMPLTKDPKIVQSLVTPAEISRARAIAHEENKMGLRQVSYVSDAELARMGYLDPALGIL